MLILPQGHARSVATRRKFTGREKWILSAVGIVVAALVVAVLISFGKSDPKSGHGCIYTTFASSLGGQPLSACGAKARTMCAEAGVPGNYTGQLESVLLLACRQAGLPPRAGAASGPATR